MHNSGQNHPFGIPSFLSGGEMGKRIQEFNWASTSLGPVQLWSPSLRSALSICLNSNFPIAIYWGPDLILLYNDAWSDIPGKKHPWALGQPAEKVWPDIWKQIQPQFQKAFTGEPGGSKDALLPMQRHGYTEECYFDFTFTPIIGESGHVEGVFNAVIETTYRIISERRNAFLQKLTNTLAHVLSSAELIPAAIAEVSGNLMDIPFCEIYSLNKEGLTTLKGTTLPHTIRNSFKQGWPLQSLLTSGKSVHIHKVSDFLTELPAGYWPEPPTEALITGLKGTNGSINGFMVLGISARRGFDNEYQSFLESVASVLSAAGNNLQSLEQERQKAESLAEIDRAKTTFFSNISHEFRTPLTLLLGPLEEALNDAGTIPENRFRLDVAFRNALRLQKLVNSLLEFSRIEAGRVEGTFTRVDLPAYTADLASTFRSAIEKAGMQLKVNVTPVSANVYVDRDMWEKIILNLLSNAFKYSKEGTITVSVHQAGEQVQVSIADTGIGIPEDQLNKIFDRFHRVENTEGRSQEGSGIGLAMVKELVRLHHGAIQVESVVGKGSTFTLTIPTGAEHIAKEKIITDAGPIVPTGNTIYSEEAMSWLPNRNFPGPQDAKTAAPLPSLGTVTYRHRVLLADDNTDMRAYVERLLSEHFDVETAVDGEDAFEKMLIFKPDLLLSDVMMPGLDGFGLLQKIRNRPELKQTPVIFLSARAGEEAKVEGLKAGADDYLVKPFSAKELLVRVTNLIRINQVRRETEQQFYQLFLQAPAIINAFRGAEMRYEFFHPRNKDIFGDVDFTGKKISEVLPELESQGIFKMLNDVYEKGITIHESERLIHFTSKDGKPFNRYFNFTYQPWFDLKGQIQGVLNFAIDVTEIVEARKKVEQSEKRFRSLVEHATVATAVFEGENMVLTLANEVMLRNWRLDKSIIGQPLLQFMPELVNQPFPELLKRVYLTGETYTAQDTLVSLTIDGKPRDRYMDFSYKALPNFKNDERLILVMATDVTEKVLSRQKIEEVVAQRTHELGLANDALQRTNSDLVRSNQNLEEFAYAASHDLKEPIRKIMFFTNRLKSSIKETLDADNQRYFERMENSAIRMNILVDDLLSYSRLDAQSLQMQQVDLNAVVKQVLEDLELEIEQKNAVIEITDLPVVNGFFRQLQQAFQNLIANALKFHKPGEVPLIRISNQRVMGPEVPQNRLLPGEHREYQLIEVADNGIGFEQGEEEQIFKIFSRLHGKTEYAGTGIGLSIVRKVAETHNGVVVAKGQPGQGACFQLYLPAIS